MNTIAQTSDSLVNKPASALLDESREQCEHSGCGLRIRLLSVGTLIVFPALEVL